MGDSLTVTPLPLAGAAEIRTTLRGDARGWFARWFCQEELSELNGGRPIQQVNSSFTQARGSVRGLHFQLAPHAEDKVIRCIQGRVHDVLVDLRRDSATFGQWHAVELDAERANMVYVPRGFAHGFQTLAPDCQMLYLHTEFFAPEHQGGLRWDSPDLGIAWPLPLAEISLRDAALPRFDDHFEGLDA